MLLVKREVRAVMDVCSRKKQIVPFTSGVVGVIVVVARVVVSRVVVARVVVACVVEAGVEELLCDILLHDALNPFSLTVPSEVSLMKREFPTEFIGPMILLEQNFPISGESRLLPSLISTKSYPQLPEFSK